MRQSPTVLALTIASLLFGTAATAQPRRDRDDRHPPANAQHQTYQQNYYYNGRWIAHDEWQRRGNERERWARNHQKRYGQRDSNDSTALMAGIIGFTMGAAILGSQQEAQQARSRNRSWDASCSRRYRSYDRSSGTYLGYDGYRHYCVR